MRITFWKLFFFYFGSILGGFWEALGRLGAPKSRKTGKATRGKRKLLQKLFPIIQKIICFYFGVLLESVWAALGRRQGSKIRKKWEGNAGTTKELLKSQHHHYPHYSHLHHRHHPQHRLRHHPGLSLLFLMILLPSFRPGGMREAIKLSTLCCSTENDCFIHRLADHP